MQSKTGAAGIRRYWWPVVFVTSMMTSLASAGRPRYQLLGLRCGAHDLRSPTVLSAAALLSDICRENLSVATRDLSPAGQSQDDTVALEVVVEHSPAPVPAASGSTVLLTAPVAAGTNKNKNCDLFILNK